ncbi:MAG: diguanylate cyclase, partial [Butyrivibrio sp.]|nr:diguanylate cyclase [Butyrivibrio sp.]
VVRNRQEDVFGMVYMVRRSMTVILSVISVGMILLSILIVSRQMKPIKEINAQILRLRDHDFSKGHQIDNYCARSDEFGTISIAVKELHRAVESQYELFAEVMETQTVGTLVTRADNTEVVLINRTAMKFFGLNPKKKDVSIADIRNQFDEEAVRIVDENMARVGSAEEGVSYEVSIMRGDELLYILTHAKQTYLTNGSSVIIFSMTDITDRKNLENHLLILSETDALTGICNRRSGESRVKSAIEEGRGGMFCLFDVDKFKYVNDNYGHGAGDDVLVAIAKTMKHSFRGTDVLIRLGGDEFVVFAVDVPDEAVGRMIIERFMSHILDMEIPSIQGHHISISLGALLMEPDDDFDRMYTKADSLMYDCKKKTGSSYMFYHSSEIPS